MVPPAARALRKLKTVYIRELQRILGEIEGGGAYYYFSSNGSQEKIRKIYYFFERYKENLLEEAQNEMRQKMAALLL